MIDPRDMAHCREAIRTGSLSFHAASRLLPAHVRDPALALYAFCRMSDDAVDDGADKGAAVLALRDRLDLVYRGTPADAPADRAFAAVVEGFDMPRALPEALLEGFAWDAVGRRYDDLSGVMDYSARVAATVGAMMCVLMRVRDPDALARACDLGLAMQLTNIARDVGEDARAGRLYLPMAWLREEGIDPEAFLGRPKAWPGVARATLRLLDVADGLYLRAEAGVPSLPLSCRPGIYAARLIYDAIGGCVRRRRGDSVTARARTGRGVKLACLASATGRAALSAVRPAPAVLHAAAVPEVAFLVRAAAREEVRRGRSEALLSVLAQLEARDRGVA